MARGKTEEKQEEIQTRYPLPPEGSGDFVEFHGQLRMGDIWEINEADERGDTRILARKFPKIVKAIQVTDPDTGEPIDIKIEDPNSYGQLTLQQYRSLGRLAGDYIRAAADVGN